MPGVVCLVQQSTPKYEGEVDLGVDCEQPLYLLKYFGL